MYKYRFYDVNPVRMITVFHKDRATPTRKLDRNKVYLSFSLGVPPLSFIGCIWDLVANYTFCGVSIK